MLYISGAYAQVTNTNTIVSGGTINSGTTALITNPTTAITGAITNNGQLLFQQSGLTITDAFAISGTGSLTMNGSGTTTLSGNNSYTGGTLLTNGALSVDLISDSGVSRIGNSGALSMGGGTLIYSGNTSSTTARLVDISTANTNSAVVVSDPNGSLTFSGSVWNSDPTHSNVVLNKFGSGTLEIGGAGANAGLSLAAKEGVSLLNALTNAVYEIRALDTNATVRLLGNNQVFSGNAPNTTGNIRMTGGTFDLNGFNQKVNAVIGAALGTYGTGTITSAGTSTLTLGTGLAGRHSYFAGTIQGGISLEKNGSSSLTLTGDNTYTGGTLINDGNLFIGTNGTTGTLGSGNVTNNANLLFSRSNDYLVGNLISGTGALFQNGDGTLTLTGANTYSGQTSIQKGALQIGNGGSTGSLGSGDVTNDAQLIFNRSNDYVVGNLISGTGSLTQVGAGTTILVGVNTYSGGTTINSGGIVTRNAGALGTGIVTMNAGALTVQNQSLQISSLVWNGGVIALPNAGSGIYLVSTGALILTGSGTFNLTGATLTVGTPTKLLGATNMDEDFTTNRFSIEGVSKYSLSISNDILWIDLLNNPDPIPPDPVDPAYPNFVIPGLTPNQLEVAGTMNVWATNNPVGDQATVLGALTNIPSNQWAAAYDQMSARFYQQMSTIAFNLANAQNNELVQRMFGLRAAGTGFSMSGFADNMAILEGQGDGVLDAKKDILRPGADTHWGMFVDGNGMFGSASSGNMLPNYNFQSGGITTGLTYQWSDTFLTGLYAGYQGAYAKNAGLGTLIDNSVRFGLISTYGTASGKGFYADALLGGGYNNYQISRTIQFGSINRTANSSPGAGELDSMIAAGYNWKKGNWAFGPVGSLQYTYFGMNGFNETGAQSLNLANQGWNASSMISSLGANCAYSWQAKKDIMVVPQINLGWQHEFLQNPYSINSTMSGTPLSNTGATPIRDTLYTGVGFTVEFAKKWNTSFFYNAAAGNSDLTSQNIFWSAGVKF
jgi:autotransporter-associated beta strand protein